jgi:copper chaperone CopZ
MSEGNMLERVALAVGSMTCGSCANSVSRALSRFPGVARVEVEVGAGWAMVEGSARPENLLAAVERAGYQASLTQGQAPEGRPTARGCQCGC